MGLSKGLIVRITGDTLWLIAVVNIHTNPRVPSLQIIPTLGPKVCKCYLRWAIWIPRVTTYYLDPTSRQNNGPTPLITAQKAIILHTFGVQVSLPDPPSTSTLVAKRRRLAGSKSQF